MDLFIYSKFSVLRSRFLLTVVTLFFLFSILYFLIHLIPIVILRQTFRVQSYLRSTPTFPLPVYYFPSRGPFFFFLFFPSNKLFRPNKSSFIQTTIYFYGTCLFLREEKFQWKANILELKPMILGKFNAWGPTLQTIVRFKIKESFYYFQEDCCIERSYFPLQWSFG